MANTTNRFIRTGPSTDINIASGDSVDVNNAGQINVTGGQGSSTAGSQGGAVTITGGTSVNTAQGGSANVIGGLSNGYFYGGEVNITGGDSAGYRGGLVNITGGNNIPNTYYGGNVNIDGGVGYSGGSVFINGGEAGSVNGAGGDVTLRARGGGTASGSPGSVRLQGGQPVIAAVNADGGNIELFAGQGQGGGDGGNVTISAPSVTAGGDGGIVTIVAGGSVGGSDGAIVFDRITGAGVDRPVEVRFRDSSGTDTNFMGFMAPDTVITPTIWTLPDQDATVAGQVLSSNALGVLSWVSASAVTELSDADADTYIRVEETADDDIIRMGIGDNTGNFTTGEMVSLSTSIFNITTPSGAAGNTTATPLTISTGDGFGTGDGGIMTIETGAGTDASGFLDIKSGNATARSGNVFLRSGDSTTANTGQILLRTGASTAAGFSTGNMTLNTGGSQSSSGAISISSGFSFDGDSGNVTIRTGGSNAVLNDTGNILLQTGDQNGGGTGPAGDIRFLPGSGPGGDGSVLIETSATAASNTELRFLEDPANGSEYVGFRAPLAIGTNVIWTLPDADATIAGQALVSDAAGILSWSSTTANEVTDDDGDTYIRVEEAADDDTIRMRIGDNLNNYNVGVDVLNFNTTSFDIIAPDTIGANQPGIPVTISAGDGAGTAAGGAVTINAGSSLGGTASAGSVLINGGDTSFAGEGGNIGLRGGQGITSNGAVYISVTGTNAGDTGELRFAELLANGTGHVGFKAPDAIGSNIMWTLPDADATASGQVLSSNAAGILSWVSSPVAAGVEDADGDTYIRVEETPDDDTVRIRFGNGGDTDYITGVDAVSLSVAGYDFIAPDTVNGSGGAGIPINIIAGNGDGGADAGSITIQAGSRTGSGGGSAGTVEIIGGDKSTGGGDGNVNIRGGNGVAGQANPHVKLYGGGQAGTGSTGGDIRFLPAAGTSNHGTVQLFPPLWEAGTDTVTGEFRFRELSSNGSGYVGFQAPLSVTTNTVWTLPDDDATASGQALISDGSGNLSWSSTPAITQLIDDDGDTLVTVEDSADDDSIIMRIGDNSGTFDPSANAMDFNTSSGFTLNPPPAISSNGGLPFVISSGDGFGTGTGGTMTIQSGSGGATNGAGGAINITASDGSSTTGTGGSVSISGGSSGGTGNGGNINLTPGNGTNEGHVQLLPAGTGGNQTTQMRWYELAANGNNFVGFRALDNLTATTVWHLPSDDATVSGAALISDAAGDLSWTTGAVGNAPTTEYLTIAVLNTIPNLAVNANSILSVSVNGVIAWGGTTPHFSHVSGTNAVSWSAANAGMNLAINDQISVMYIPS